MGTRVDQIKKIIDEETNSSSNVELWERIEKRLYSLYHQPIKQHKIGDFIMACIYENKPESCTMCMQSVKLQCLLNKPRHKLTKTGRMEIISLAYREMRDERRIK
jgi:hypothetical protein